MPDDPVVLTGCGWVTPFAIGSISEVLAAARGVAPPSAPDDGFWGVPELDTDEHPHLPAELRGNKGNWMAALALEHACRTASLDIAQVDHNRLGLVLGCALAGQLGMITFANEVREQTARFVSPIHFPQTVGNYTAGALARAYGIRGPNLTVACGVASGLEAVAEGYGLLTCGRADVVVAGGVDALSKDMASGLSEPDLLLSEGACLFTLERVSRVVDRGVEPLATIVGFSHEAASAPVSTGVPGRIVSSTDRTVEGAIFVEHRVGRCFAALGVAAVAAAIGVARGDHVPFTKVTGEGTVSTGSGARSASAAERAAGAIVSATDESPGAVPTNASRITLELALPNRT